jgi:uncharacterized membrane protein
MEKKNFSNKEAIKYGWDIMKANFWFFVGIIIVAGLIVGIPSNIADRLNDPDLCLLGFIFNIIAGVARAIISIGLIKIALIFLNKEKPEFKELFNFKGSFWRFIGGSILYGLIVVAGFILLIIPGIYWAIKYQWFGYCIVDQKLGPVQALKKSAQMTDTVKWQLLGFGLVMTGINILGFLCLFIGLFATIPTTLLATTFVYRKLLSQTESAQATIPAPQEKKP